MTTSNNPHFNTLASQLQSYGLGALFSVKADGSPSGWLWDQIKSGVVNDAELMSALEQTDVFRDRFSVIVAQQERAARGEPVYVMSPAEVLDYEKRATAAMQSALLPGWFYDEPTDFNEFILNGITVPDIEDRLEQAYEYVTNAPDEVRAKFEEYYGVGQSDAALAAYVLDPNRTLARLNRAKRSAYTAGMAERYGLTVSRSVADRIADLPRNESGLVEGLRRVSQQAGLFEQALFENDQITAGDALAAEFDGDADALRALERRRIRRGAGDRVATGGAVVTHEGFTGAGSSGGT